jgi:hypothetical protein
MILWFPIEHRTSGQGEVVYFLLESCSHTHINNVSANCTSIVKFLGARGLCWREPAAMPRRKRSRIANLGNYSKKKPKVDHCVMQENVSCLHKMNLQSSLTDSDHGVGDGWHQMALLHSDGHLRASDVTT